MNYKSIFKAVGVVSVAAIFSIGCGGDNGGGNPVDPNNPDNGGGSGGLVGDWAIVEYVQLYDRTDDGVDDVGKIVQIGDDEKAFFSFGSSGDLITTSFARYNDFWIELIDELGKYNISGDSVCVGDGEYVQCFGYSISGNALTLLIPDYRSYKLVKKSLASTKNSLGKVYGQATALKSTAWERESSGPNCGECYISFWESGFRDGEGVYSDVLYVPWYTDGSRLTLVIPKEECEQVDEHSTHCTITNEVEKTVTLDYEFTADGNLRLRQTGGDWDVWTPRNNDDNMYKTRLKSKEGRYAIIPFFKDFRR